MTAESLDGTDTEYNSIRQRKQHHSNNNKTRKQANFQNMTMNDEKVNSVLQSIHNRSIEDDDEQDTANYSFGQSNSIMNKQNKLNKEGMANRDVPQPLEPHEMELQKIESNYMNDDQVKEYYKKIIPGFNPNAYTELSNIKKHTESTLNSNSMVDKLNYIINLLEEQQDQRTNNVTEEVILYSFLGVFIIFVVDGFTRVGKYVR